MQRNGAKLYASLPTLHRLNKPAHLLRARSTAFGCSLQGVVAEEDVVRVALALREAGADAISLPSGATQARAKPANSRISGIWSGKLARLWSPPSITTWRAPRYFSTATR